MAGDHSETPGPVPDASAKDIRLLLADVDGTLVTRDKVLTEAAIQATRDLAVAGVALALTSARSPRGMRMLIQPLALHGALVGFNGGLYVRPDLSVIRRHAIDAATARATVDLLRDQGLDVWVYTEKDWLVGSPHGPHVAREAWILQFDAQVVSDFSDDDLDQALKIVGVSDDLPLVARCEAGVRHRLGDRVSAARSEPHFLDVTHPEANKGAVVLALAQQLNIAPEQVAAIGDMPTDVMMFQKSGLSIAMGNASEAVKAKADVVTDSNEDDGFAKAVRRFVLPPAPAHSRS